MLESSVRYKTKDVFVTVIEFGQLTLCLSPSRFKLEEGDLKYLDEARELIRPERNTLTVSFLDMEEHSTKLATLVQEHYYQ